MSARIFTSDTVYQRQRRARKREEKLTTRLGQSIVIDAPPIGEMYGLLDDWRVVARQRILMADRNDLRPEERGPGSWVVTLRGTVEEEGPFAGVLKYAPLVAVVTYGTGETQTTIEVDAWRSTFAVPADTISIDVGYSRFGVTGAMGAFLPGALFDRVRVDATLHRSLETGEAIPTRSYPLLYDLGATQPVTVHSVPVPPQAVAWGAWYGREVATSANQLGVDVLSGDPGSPNVLVLDAPQDDEVNTLMQRMCFRPLHPQSQRLNVEYLQGAPPGLFTLTYQIGF